MLGALCGCVGADAIQPYPDNWPAASPHYIADCPSLAGRYAVLGIQRGLEERCSKQRQFDATGWDCSARLDDAFTLGARVDDVELVQPGPELLVVTGSGADGAKASRTLHRDKGEFVCEAGSLSIVRTTSLFGDEDVLATVGGMMILRAGVSRVERAFSRGADGSLVMNVSETNQGLFFPFPFSATFTAWVRWPLQAPEAAR